MAVPVISWDSFTPSTPVAEYPGTPELQWQSRDYSGTPSPPSTIHRSYTGIPGIILGLPHSPAHLWQSILVHRSYTGGPGIILGLPHLKSPYAEYLRNE